MSLLILKAYDLYIEKFYNISDMAKITLGIMYIENLKNSINFMVIFSVSQEYLVWIS